MKSVLFFLAVALFFTSHAHADEYATWNPSDKGPGITLSGGDLTVVRSSSATYSGLRATLSRSSGKWCWENAVASMTTNLGFGVATASSSLTSILGADAGGWSVYHNGQSFHNGTYTTSPISYTSGDVIGLCVDLDVGALWVAKNGVWVGNPSAGTGAVHTGVSGAVYPASIGHGAYQFTSNFGATSFTYPVPTGFNAGWFLPDEQTSEGLYVCSHVNVGATSCESFVPLLDDIATFSELGIDGPSVVLAFGFGFGTVFVLWVFGFAHGQVHRLVRGILRGDRYENI